MRSRGAPVNLGRIFANAIARRVAYVLVGLVCLWLGLGDARAQNTTNPDQGAAYAACQSAHAAALANPHPQYDYQPAPGCVLFSVQRYYSCGLQRRAKTCPGCSFSTISCGAHYYPAGGACNTRPSSTFTHDLAIPTGSVGCSNGCEFVVTNNGDGTYNRGYTTPGLDVCNVLPDCPTTGGWYTNHVTGLCTPEQEECPANKTKNPKTGACEEACPTGMVMDPTGACKPSQDDCPAGNVRAPSGQCLPGDGQCAAGEARRDNGTCGIDSDGDGQADEDDDDPENDPDKPSASGGDTCDVPPSCSGGPIDCLQAKIQWRIDCNTRSKVNITGGACGAMPVCVGENCKAMEYSQLLMQWRTACALEKLKLPGAEEGGDGEQIKPDFEALAAGGDGANPDDSIFLPDGDSESFSESLVSYGSGALGWNFTIEGQQFTMPQQIKDWLPAIRWLIIAGATLVGIGIAWGKL